MKNRLACILLFYWACSNFMLHAQPDSLEPIEVNAESIKEIFIENKEDEKIRYENFFRSAATDTAQHAVTGFATGFADKYLDDEDFNYNTEQGEKNFLARLLVKIYAWLKKLLAISPSEKTFNITTWLFKAVSILVLLAVVYFLVRILISHKGKWFFQQENQSLPIDINDTQQLIESADFRQLILASEKQGNTRQGIRLFYLWLLKDLKDKGLIAWLPEKTNADYLAELRDEGLRRQFTYLSYLYNFIWYGEFSITDSDYISARNAFLLYLGKDKLNG